jgi:hypothetical protein
MSIQCSYITVHRVQHAVQLMTWHDMPIQLANSRTRFRTDVKLYLNISSFLFCSCFIYFSLLYFKFHFLFSSTSIPPPKILFLGAFAPSQKAHIALFVSFRPFVCLSACVGAASIRGIFVIVDIIGFSENLPINFKFGWNWAKILVTVYKDLRRC